MLSDAEDTRVGAVVIGRNEGERLRRCLESLALSGRRVVYVDSGSADGSVELARALGADVVELDTSVPFSAARARNTGFERLMSEVSDLAYVQFIDGDCALSDGWLERGVREADSRPDVAVVVGRRREMFPEASIYNRLCDIEWDTPIGEAKFCGGDALMRVEAFRAVGGFNPLVVAGEEPELCVRLRSAGWRIVRVDVEMTRHDAAMTRFGQWWKRAFRAGYAYALGAVMHGRSSERHWVRETRSIWFWGLLLPLAALGCAWFTRGASLLTLLAYPALVCRIYRSERKRGRCRSDARLNAVFCILCKLPQVFGQIRLHLDRLLRRRVRLIEYKTRPVCNPSVSTGVGEDPVAARS